MRPLIPYLKKATETRVLVVCMGTYPATVAERHGVTLHVSSDVIAMLINYYSILWAAVPIGDEIR